MGKKFNFLDYFDTTVHVSSNEKKKRTVGKGKSEHHPCQIVEVKASCLQTSLLQERFMVFFQNKWHYEDKIMI